MVPEMSEEAERSQELVKQIMPMLADQGPEVQGAVLVDLVAMHLAGHFIPGDRMTTRQLREELLKQHIDCVRKLISVNARMIGTVVTHDEH
jgi:hypothetical protein